jgi:tetratricopeptide (TPR) repeat protein
MSDAASLEDLRAALESARATRGQPDLLRAYRALGEGYLAAEQLDEAESAFRTSVQQARIWNDARDLGLALLGLGRTLVKTGRTDRALLAFTEAVGSLHGVDAEATEAAAAEVRALRDVPGGAR